MPRDSRSSSSSYSPRQGRYSQQTLRPIYNLLFVLPLLAFFHFGAAWYGTSLYAVRDLGRLLDYFGATGLYLPGLLIVAALVAQHVARPGRGRLKLTVLGGMAGESIVCAAPLAAMNLLTGMILTAAADGATPGQPLLRELLRDTGAGLYEEFIFRLAFISLAVLVFVDVFELRKDVVVILAIVVSAVLFSLYHFPPHQFSQGLSFPWKEFLFRAAAGLYLGGLYVVRGFGITVGAHITYNVYAFLSSAVPG